MTENEKLDLLINKFSSFESDITKIKADVSDLKTDVSDLKTHTAHIDDEIIDMHHDMDAMKANIAVLDNRTADMFEEIKKIKLTLENETNPNIQYIAEGHLDLNRKLNEAIHLASDIKAKQEINDILITRHERQLKVPL